NTAKPIQSSTTTSRTHTRGPLAIFLTFIGYGRTRSFRSREFRSRPYIARLDHSCVFAQGRTAGAGASRRRDAPWCSALVDVRRERPDEREVAVLLRVVEAVADDELVG